MDFDTFVKILHLTTIFAVMLKFYLFTSGWLWYYRRYIDLRKGGVGGLGMLLAGYCVLSYVWSYPHISKCVDRCQCCCIDLEITGNVAVFSPERDRWRKYH